MCKSHTCHPGFLFPSCCFKSNIVYNIHIHIHLKVNQTSEVINTIFCEPLGACPSISPFIFTTRSTDKPTVVTPPQHPPNLQRLPPRSPAKNQHATKTDPRGRLPQYQQACHYLHHQYGNANPVKNIHHPPRVGMIPALPYVPTPRTPSTLHIVVAFLLLAIIGWVGVVIALLHPI